MNTIPNIEDQLQNLQYTFTSDFERNVIQALRRKSVAIWPKISWLLTGIAASITLCLCIIYIQDGTISVDALLGVNILNSSNYNDILTYYQS